MICVCLSVSTYKHQQKKKKKKKIYSPGEHLKTILRGKKPLSLTSSVILGHTCDI